MIRAVLDTNVFVGACLGTGATNRILALAIDGTIDTVMGEALFSEHEDVLARSELFENGRLNQAERSELFDIYIAQTDWVRIYFGWRPNLRDEGDNHLIELAVAAGANLIITRNVRDFKNMELSFPSIRIITPEDFLRENIIKENMQ
ncbi:MAG: putative toxin-antitoxin system toxin component, PIN family [Burkholderiaceae bacterium]